jgi:hypothetical protein
LRLGRLRNFGRLSGQALHAMLTRMRLRKFLQSRHELLVRVHY